MKHYSLFLTVVLALTALVAQAQADDYTPPEVIFNQPEGELRIYERSGSVLHEDEYTQEHSVRQQSGTIAMVFAPDGATVYLQVPVSSYTMGGSWVRGSLSADGTTIDLPLGQYVDYTRSFDMAYQLQLMSLEGDTYVVDSLTASVSYAIGTDGTIALQGTSQELILGLVIRTFGHPLGSAIGQDFSYLNGEWLGFGDFESLYTPTELEVLTPPEQLATQQAWLTTANYDGATYWPYEATVRTGVDDATGYFWLQGITSFLPQAWVRGTCSADAITLPTGQLLGTVEGIPLYLHGAALDADGNFTIKDIDISREEDRYVTYDYLFISTSATALEYITFYQGATIAPRREVALTMPDGAAPVAATMSYTDQDGRPAHHSVDLALQADSLYLQAPWPLLPQACVRGSVGGGQVVFDMPQYLGTYTAEDTVYPIYFTAFDAATGEVLRQLTFTFDAAELSLTDPSAPVSIGINKTGYLSVQDYFGISITSSEQLAIRPTVVRGGQSLRSFDLGGRRTGRSGTGISIREGRKVIQHQ